MHVVGVPVATGYKRGLSKQVAKTKVFDQKRLETIQDQMHDFVEQQMKDHPEISEALKESKDVADYQVENSLYRLATGYVDSEGKWHPPNITAIIFWLKNRKPQEWREKRELYGKEKYLTGL